MLVPDLQDYHQQFQAIKIAAHTLLGDLTEIQLNWQRSPTRWSIAQCIDHLLVTGSDSLSHIYVAINEARSKGLFSQGPLKEVAADSTVTATVELGGFDRECGYGSVAASCTTMVLKKVDARKLDEYGSLKPKEENAKLDNFMTELNLDPTAQCYIIAYNGRTSRVGAQSGGQGERPSSWQAQP